MKMHKLWTILLSIILALGVCLAFASCGTPDEDDGGNDECTSHVDSDGDGVCDTDGCGAAVTPSPAPSGDYFNENGELILFKGGVPTFKIIKGGDVSDVAADVDDLAATLSKLSASTVVAGNQDTEVQAVEILVGSVTNRGDEYKINKYTLGEKGYMVKQIGTKIVVQGGSKTGLKTAVDYLKETVFGIKKTNDNFTDFVMAAAKNLEAPQDDYRVKSVKIDGNAINNYTIYYNNTSAKSVATDFRNELYSKVGVHLELTGRKPAEDTPTIQFNVVENTGVGNGFDVKVEDGNLVINCEFDYLFEDLATAFYKTNITEAKRSNVTFEKGVIETEDIRNIYYEDFGAVGDGVTNDFAAIRKAHLTANEHGHTVNGTAGATYYIGSTGGEHAPVQTNVNWNGCKFIFDDSVIKVHDATTCPLGADTSKCVECADRQQAIFFVSTGYSTQNVTSLFEQYNKDNILKGGYNEPDNTTVIPGWNLGYDALVFIQNYERKVFIRVGPNETSGEYQGEYILVHKDGTIDPTTPLTWDYTYISSARAYNVDEAYIKPITIDGGGAYITTIANTPGDDVRNGYNAFGRNIQVRRSNVTIQNINHRIEEDPQAYRAPYSGMFYTGPCNNVVYRDLTVQAVNRRYDDNGVLAGTYEFQGGGCNNARYYNVKTVNFFSDGTDQKSATKYCEPGEQSFGGFFGSNYCRNFYFEDCRFNGWDSHKGSGNVTFKNCTLGAINILGSGDLTVEDTVFYIDRKQAFVTLRPDFAQTFRGSFTMRNVEIKFSRDYTAGNTANKLILFNSHKYDPNMDGDTVLNEQTGKYEFGNGWDAYLPEKMTLENVTLKKYVINGYDKESDSITEEYVDFDDKIYLFHYSLYSYKNNDLSKEYPNRLIAPKELIISGCDDIFVIPTTPQFKNMKYTLDGVVQK